MEFKTLKTKKKIEEFQMAYVEGREAALRGLTYFQNPYIPGTVKHNAWARGWKAVGR